jgi:dTDP-4-amino-4,6-dideoxygalactose transaminase
MGRPKRIYLSPPDVNDEDRRRLLEAFDSNWIAPLGPQVDAFEEEMGAFLGVPHCLALCSGTAALHLALLVLGVERGDEVICSTLTFAASVNAIRYLGAEPVFIDSEAGSWNLDPELLAAELEECDRRGKLPRAIVAVDLYGQCARYDAIGEIAARHGIPIIEDAAEALGAHYGERPAGSFGRLAILSFNGNKIITTSGGGMLVSDDEALVEQARHLATQAREPAVHYEHHRVGYNYRLSNLLAALGRGQLGRLPERVNALRKINREYRRSAGDLPGIEFMPEVPLGRSTFWLTACTIDSAKAGCTSEDVRRALEEENIEARPVWKPMHLQPAFRAFRSRGGEVAEELFRTGLCLPSGAALSEAELESIVAILRSTWSPHPAGRGRGEGD